MLNKGNIKIQGKIVKCVHLLSAKPYSSNRKNMAKKILPKEICVYKI